MMRARMGDSLPWLGEKEGPAGADLPATMSAFLRIRSALPPTPDVGSTPGECLKLTQRRPAGDEVYRQKVCQ